MMDIFLDSEKKGRADAANTNALGMNMFFNTFFKKSIAHKREKVKRMGEDDFNFALLLIVFLVGIFAISLVYTKIHPENEDFTLKAEPIVKEEVVEIPEELSGGHETIEVKVTEEVVEEKKPVLSDEDIMAIVAECEAGNQEIIGRVAVIATILNRCDYYGETVETVVYKPNQYAFDKDVVPSEESYLAVKIALRERDLFPRTMMWFLPSGYSKYGEPYMKIQDHYFNYLSEE